MIANTYVAEMPFPDIARAEQMPPLDVFVFNQIGDMERRALHLDNVGSADGRSNVLRLDGWVSCGWSAPASGPFCCARPASVKGSIRPVVLDARSESV